MSEIREALEAAVSASSNEEAPAEVVESAPAPVAAETSVAEATPVEAAETATETVAQAAERLRDGKGRFAGKTTATPPPVTAEKTASGVVPPATATGTPPPATAAATATEAPKPPQSWKPAAREQWAKLPAEVQAEVSRRETETQRVLQESAPARKLAQEFHNIVSPYMPQIQAEGGDPLKAVASFFQTAQALRTAPPAHKARLIASMVQNFGVPIDALAAALDGGAAPQGAQQQTEPYRDPRVDQIEQMLAQAFQQKQATQQQKAQAGIEAISKKDFFEDVRHDMADILGGAAQRGLPMTLDEAYARACRANPDVWAILQQREQAAAASTANAARARAASSSVRSQPAGPASSGSADDIRGALQASMSKLNGSR